MRLARLSSTSGRVPSGQGEWAGLARGTRKTLTYIRTRSYAGEDAPKCLFPTAFATVPSSDPSQPPTYVHGNNVHLYRPHATVSSFVADQIVTDWDAAGRALEHAFQDRMRVKTLEEFPLMATEPSWNTKENKEKMCELAFETWQTPAFYSVDKAVMIA